jgi:nucleotide-binding universal stress UspA family protein
VRERSPVASVAEFYAHTPLLAEFETAANDRAEAMRAAFEEAAASVVRREFLVSEGNEGVDLAPAARTADLVVCPAPAACERRDGARLIESVLVGCSRPVLVTGEGAGAGLPRRVLIAWNGSVEAARAVAVARPLLSLAGSVAVASVGPVEAGAPGPEEVAEALARSGIEAAGRTLAKQDRSVSETLAAHARDEGCDALLLGAYSHSRLQQRVFGGVTRRAVEKPALPTIMVH